MSRNEETIHHYNFGYKLLKAYETFSFKRFYKHIQVIGVENIPFGSQYIFAPNHQNALMDALAVVQSARTDIVFFARADIFKNERQAKFLRLIKILPIYRMRDGASELTKNEEIFQSAITILGDHVPICIMPEGNHGDKRRLRNLVKGLFRIAFRTQEPYAGKKAVKIVPVGLDYSHYSKFFQDLLIIYGQPIEVADYFDLYEENQPRAINELRKRLAEELMKVMIHIESEEYYDVFQNLRSYYNNRMRKKAGILGRTHYERFRADKLMIRILDNKLETEPTKISGLAGVVREYEKGLSDLNLRNWIFERSGFTTKRLIYKRFGLILSSPFFLYGYLNNWLPFNLPVNRIKNVKDPQFHSSFKFVLAMIFFPVFYALQTAIVAILTSPAWIAWAYLLSLPLTGYFALFWSIWYKRWKAGLKYRKLKKSRDDKILELEKNYHLINGIMDEIVDEYLKTDKSRSDQPV